jgi:hypothetical protein
VPGTSAPAMEEGLSMPEWRRRQKARAEWARYGGVCWKCVCGRSSGVT